jgi:DNA-directed RNA polymerase specialized sigma24 family protein
MTVRDFGERELLEAVGGPPAVFDAALARFIQACRLAGLIRVKCRSDEDAQDVLQIATLRLVAYLPRYNPALGSLVALTREIAANAAIDFYRVGRHARELTGTLDDAAATLAAPEPVDAGAVRDLFISLWFALGFDTRQGGFDEWHVHMALLTTAFDETDSPAHELVTYGFHHYLEWKPAAIVEELAMQALCALAARLGADFISASGMPADKLRPVFAGLSHRTAGLRPPDVTLAHFFENKPPTVDITRWSYAVFRRTVVALRNKVRPHA